MKTFLLVIILLAAMLYSLRPDTSTTGTATAAERAFYDEVPL